ncbi:MAG: Gfo/Idh/MocA family oxidoreductase [Sumerlaeia bacterium]
MSKNAVILGGGAIAINFHLPRVKTMLGAERVVVVEVSAPRREELAREFGSDRSVEIVESLPATGQFDFAVIATPPKFHFEYFEQLKGRARDILIEKPMTLNAEEARRVAEICAGGGPRVYVALIRRTLGGFALIREMIRANQFGALKKVTLTEGGIFGWMAVSMGSFSRTLNGGGVLMDTGPHTIDLLFQVFDTVEFQASWMDADLSEGGETIEANCTLDLLADGAVPVRLSLSRNRNFSNLAVFEFEAAVCKVGVRDDEVTVDMASGVPLKAMPTDEFAEMGKDFKALFDRYYARFLLRQDNTGVAPEDSEKIARIIDAAYQNAQPIKGGF